MKVDVDGLANAIQKELEDFKNKESKKMEEVIVQEVKSGLKDIRSASPINRYHNTNRGRYKKGWRQKTIKGNLGHVESVIYNKTDWQLTHLLENGFYHVKSNRQIPGRMHIAPVQQRIEAKVLRGLKTKL